MKDLNAMLELLLTVFMLCAGQELLNHSSCNTTTTTSGNWTEELETE